MSTKLTYEELKNGNFIKVRPLTQEDQDRIVDYDIRSMIKNLKEVKFHFEYHNLNYGVDNHDYKSRIDSLIELIEEDYKEDIDNLVV